MPMPMPNIPIPCPQIKKNWKFYHASKLLFFTEDDLTGNHQHILGTKGNKMIKLGSLTHWTLDTWNVDTQGFLLYSSSLFFFFVLLLYSSSLFFFFVLLLYSSSLFFFFILLLYSSSLFNIFIEGINTFDSDLAGFWFWNFIFLHHRPGKCHGD